MTETIALIKNESGRKRKVIGVECRAVSCVRGSERIVDKGWILLAINLS
jgi:hypothetical protein